MSAGTVSVYAITNSRTVPVFPGLRAMRVGALTALVRDVRRVPAPTPANLRTYHRAVGSIAASLPAVLPVRFATTMTEAELALVLRSRAASFAAALRRVRGRVQMTLRVPLAGRGEGARLSGSKVAAARPAAISGREYLRERAAREHDRAGLGSVPQAVAAWVDAEQVERHGDVLSVYHLVRRRDAGAYARAATEAFAASGIRAVVSGPFPAYAFSSW